MEEQCELSKCARIYGDFMTEVLSIKYEGTGNVTYVLPNQNYQVGDCLVIKNKGSRLAQAVTTNEEIDEVKLPAEMDKVLRLANEKICRLIKKILS